MNDLTTEDKMQLKVFKLEERIADLEAENKRLKEDIEEVTSERDNYRWSLNKMDALD